MKRKTKKKVIKNIKHKKLRERNHVTDGQILKNSGI